MRKLFACLAVVIIVIGTANFLSFVAGSMRLGGDALNGYTRDGHYFVADHGQTKEISESDWRRNRLQGISVFVTHPLALIAGFYLMFQFIFPAMIYGRKSSDRATIVYAMSQDTPIQTICCGGKIGRLNLSGPMMRVSLNAQGLLVKPFLMPSFGIRFSEITGFAFSEKWFRRGVTIEHASQSVASPIVLGCPIHSPFANALQERLKPESMR